MFGKKSLEFERVRDIDSSTSIYTDPIIELEKSSDEQVFANDTVTNLILATEKNNKILEVAAAIGEEQTSVYVPIPQYNQSDEVFSVRSSLLQKYPAESEGGTVVRFSLFKKIIDGAIRAKEDLLDRLLLSEGEAVEFTDQINNIKIGELGNILNGRNSVENSINQSSDSPKKDNSLFITLGVAFLSFQLQAQFHKLAPMYTGQDDIQSIQSDTEDKSKAAKIAVILTKIAEAVALFAIMYSMSKRQTSELASQVVPDTINSDLKQDFIKQVEGLYDNPPADLIALIPDNNQSDQSIIEYCMKYINVHPHINFEPWIIYASAALRQMQMQDVIGSMSDISTLPESITSRYTPPDNRLSSRIVYSGQSNINTDIKVKGLSSYLGDNNSNTLSFDIMNYIKLSSDISKSSGNTSNFFMSILQNNQYTPELVCCISNFLVKGNIDEALKFLKDLKGLLEVMSGFSFHYGDLLHDIINGLFNDLKSKILTYCFTQLSRFFDQRKDELLKMGDNIMGNNKYLIFCTPLSDLLAQIMRIFEEFQAILEDLIKSLLDVLLSYELNIKSNVINIAGSNRYRNIVNILDSLIFAIESGKLCQYDGLQSSDIHPDLLPIIDRLSRQPREVIKTAVESFNDIQADIISQTKPNSTNVYEFRDPEDTRYRGAVSLDREYNNESTIETIQKYSAKCQEFKEAFSNLGIADLNG